MRVIELTNNLQTLRLNHIVNNIKLEQVGQRGIQGVQGEQGIQGVQGVQGIPGVVQETFEMVSKNIKSWDATFGYTGDQLTSITYTDGVDTIVKTLNYTGSQLTSLVLSGDTPAGIDLTKTLSYTGTKLTGASYS